MIYWTLIEVGRICSMRDKFQVELERAATRLEGAMLLEDPDFGVEIRGYRKLVETSSKQYLTCEPERDPFRFYDQLPAQGTEALRKTSDPSSVKPHLDPYGCL